MRHPVAGKPEGAAARGLGRNLHRDLALERRHRDLCAERGVGYGDGQRHVEVVALSLEARIGPHGDAEIDVAPPAALDAARALTGDADAGARVDPGRNLHLEVAPALRPASAVALRARLAIDVARSAARGTGLVEFK